MKRNIIAFVLLALGVAASAQDGAVSGIIRDTDGMPVLGAVVYYDGTGVNAITDIDGRYSIKVMPGKTLVVSMLGMNEQRTVVTSPGTLDFTLSSDTRMLEDVVVIGYGTQNREDLTGAIASVRPDEIQKASTASLTGALEGKVAGLSISSQSGEPGSGYQIRIRGANSINASSEPLYVIDGVQMDLSSSSEAESDLSTAGVDPLSFLNPSDIQSIEVLKDASASAIYGARGANGVIIITTKSGVENAGKTTVTLDVSAGVSRAARRLDMLDGQEWINYRWERADYGGKSSFDDGDGHPIDVSDKKWYNWQDLMYRDAVTQNYGVTVRSKTGKSTQMLMSLGYMDQEGIVVGNDFKRYTGRVKVDHRISDRVKAGVNVNLAQNVGEGAMTSTGGGSGFSTNGLIQLIYRERPISMMTDSDDDYFSTVGFTSLLDLVNGKTVSRKRYLKAVGNAYLDWTVCDGLTFNMQAAATASNSTLKEFFSKYSRWGRQNEGVANNSSVTQLSYNASARLSYKKQWRKAHNLDAMAGGEIGESVYDKLKLSAYGFTDESTGAYDISKGKVQKSPDQMYYTVGRLSAFGRVNYNFKSRYYATLSMRADGSSRFSEGHRFGYFPSGSLGWRVSKEPFMRGSRRWLSNAMLRLSAGASGNDRIPMYSNLAQMGTNYTSASGVETMGISSIQVANPDLKWETTYQYNAGLDVSFFKNRISLTADAYYKDTRDMLYLATLSGQAGFPLAYRNLGRVDNRGIEIALNTRNLDRRSFLWTTNLTFDLSRNRVVNIGDGVDYTAVTDKGNFSTEYTRIIVGEPIGVCFGYVADGNYQFEDFIITKGGQEVTDISEITASNFNEYTYTLKDGVTSIANVTVVPGDRKYLDLDTDNKITDADRKVIGRPYPLFSAGMGNTLSWKGLELYVFVDGSYGRQMLNEFRMRTESGRGAATYQYNITDASYYGAWRVDNPSNTYSRLLNYTNEWCSSYYVEDASFLRLKTLRLSYSLRPRACRAIGFSSLKLSLTMDNVYTLTAYSGMDPSLSSNKSLFPAYDTMSYPLSRTCTLGIAANF